MSKILYEKIGDEYVPVSVYEAKMIDSLPLGNHLIMVYKNGNTKRHNVDPAFAPMIAAGRYAVDEITDAIVSASSIRPTKTPLTQEQKDAWEALSKAFGESSHMLQWPSANEIAYQAVAALQNEANALLLNPSVKHAYDEFMLICKLALEQKNDHN